MLYLFLQHLFFYIKEAQKVNQCFLNVWFLVFQCMCYKNEVLWNSLWHLKAFALSWSFSEISFLYLSKNFNIDENNKWKQQRL